MVDHSSDVLATETTILAELGHKRTWKPESEFPAVRIQKTRADRTNAARSKSFPVTCQPNRNFFVMAAAFASVGLKLTSLWTKIKIEFKSDTSGRRSGGTRCVGKLTV